MARQIMEIKYPWTGALRSTKIIKTPNLGKIENSAQSEEEDCTHAHRLAETDYMWLDVEWAPLKSESSKRKREHSLLHT